MKVATLADTHIHNFKFFEEYQEVFEKIYASLREEKPDYIVHLGDLLHTKNQISPEAIEIAANFLSSLSDIAETFVIVGNHDYNIKNPSRQDSISPIVSALGKKNLRVLKYSQEIFLQNKVALNVFSICDPENWRPEPSNPDLINVALFHGVVKGSCTELGHYLKDGDIEIDDLKNFDYGFFGDIHASNYCLEADGRFRYVGSTVQQNFGEQDNKGYLLWDIEDKRKFSVKHIIVPNPKPFVSVMVTRGKMPKLSLKENSRLKVSSDERIPSNEFKEIIDFIKQEYKPFSIITSNGKSEAIKFSIKKGSAFSENIRDLAVQEKFINRFLEKKKVPEENIKKVLDLNRGYNSFSDEDEVVRGIRWKLRRLEWDNLFNYSEGNYIDFDKLKGVVGLIAGNRSGKTSATEALLYAVFNNISKNSRKSYNIVNQNKTTGRASCAIDVDDKTFLINRNIVKKSEEDKEAKTTVEFICEAKDEEFNTLIEKSRVETDKHIRRYFGTLEDFMLTSYSSQFEFLTFIKEGSTKRKDILNKFLDLDFLKKKYEACKDDSQELKSHIKKNEGRNFGEEIEETKRKLSSNLDESENIISLTTEHNRMLEVCSRQIAEIDAFVSSVSSEVINGEGLEQEVLSLVEERTALVKSREETTRLIEKKQKEKSVLEAFLSMKDKGLYENEIVLLRSQKTQLQACEKDKEHVIKDISKCEKRERLLTEVPCGESFKECKFKTDAYSAREELLRLKSGLSVLDKQIAELMAQGIDDNLRKCQGFLEEINKNTIKKHSLDKDISEFVARVAKYDLKIHEIDSKIEKNEAESKKFQENKELFLKIKEKTKKKTEIELKKKKNAEKLEEENKKLTALYRERGSEEQKLKSLEQGWVELRAARDKYAICEYYLESMHVNGISYDIIRETLPTINEEINKILSNIVKFNVILATEDDRLEVYIQYPKYSARLIEMASGMEKTLASLAIRLALIKSSSLPQPNFFIMDEPLVSLDSENLNEFSKVFELLKEQFDIVLLITHIQELKDVVDHQISIDKIDGYAHIEV